MCRAGENTTEWEIHDGCYEKQEEPKKVVNKKKWKPEKPSEIIKNKGNFGQFTKGGDEGYIHGVGMFETFREAFEKLKKSNKINSIVYDPRPRKGYHLRYGVELKNHRKSIEKGEITWVFDQNNNIIHNGFTHNVNEVL